MFNKIVAIEPINMLDIHKSKLHELANEVVLYKNIPHDDEEIIKRIGDADCVLLSYTSQIDEFVLKSTKNIKYIGMCCSLYSEESANVDIKTARSLGITVTGIRDYGDMGVLEYVIHELTEFLEGYNNLKWDNIPHEIGSLKCGIVGLGTSGTLIARGLKFFGSNVSYYSRTRKPNIEAEGICYKDLHTLLKESDAIFLALNKNVLLLGDDEFNLMKGRKILFNTSIGPGFKIEPFKKWLMEPNHYFFGDTLATAGDPKVFNLANTKALGHSSGGSTYEAFYRLGEKVLHNMKKFVEQ